MSESSERGSDAWRKIGIVLAVGGLAVIAGFWARRAMDSGAGRAPEAETPVAAAQVAAQSLDFSLESLDGRRVDAQDFTGRVVVVDFWASWCGPCKIQGEILHALQRRYPAEDVAFVAINVGETLELVQSYVSETPFAYTVVMDPAQTLSAKYGIYALPTVMVLDREQGILFQNMGVSSGTQVSSVIDRALAAG